MSHHERFELEPSLTMPIVKRLLAIHVDIEHPVMHAEVVLVGDAVTMGPGVRLTLPFREAGRPIEGRPAAKVG
jgi:hypothetical protein